MNPTDTLPFARPAAPPEFAPEPTSAELYEQSLLRAAGAIDRLLGHLETVPDHDLAAYAGDLSSLAYSRIKIQGELKHCPGAKAAREANRLETLRNTPADDRPFTALDLRAALVKTGIGPAHWTKRATLLRRLRTYRRMFERWWNLYALDDPRFVKTLGRCGYPHRYFYDPNRVPTDHHRST